MWEVKLWFSGRKEGRKKYCFDCWWCNIDHLQFLCFNLLLYVFQIKTYTDDDWFLIWLFPLLSELFYLGIQATDITSLCLNLRFGLEPKHLTSYPNRVPSFLKLCISHSSHSLLISTFFYFFFPALLPDSSFFQGYHRSFLGYFCFFHLAILSGWSLEILDDCQGFLDIWQSIWNRMGNFIRVSAHMQMMPPAHVEAIAQIPGALVCRVCATQVVLRWMVIPACLRRAVTASQPGSERAPVPLCPSPRGWLHARVQRCLSQTRRAVAPMTRFRPFIRRLGFSALSCLLCSPTSFCLGQQQFGDSYLLLILLEQNQINMLGVGESSGTSVTALQTCGEVWCWVIFGLILSLGSSRNWFVSYDNHY